jgi:hypothetical protein
MRSKFLLRAYTATPCTQPLSAYSHSVHTATQCTQPLRAHSHSVHTATQYHLPLDSFIDFNLGEIGTIFSFFYFTFIACSESTFNCFFVNCFSALSISSNCWLQANPVLEANKTLPLWNIKDGLHMFWCSSTDLLLDHRMQGEQKISNLFKYWCCVRSEDAIVSGLLIFDT